MAEGGGGGGISSPSCAPSGYPKGIFEGDVEAKYLCTICKEILKKPCQGECGHRFCKECVQFLNKNAKHGEVVKCPACLEDQRNDVITAEEIYNLSKIFPDNAIIRDLSQKQTKCLNIGCPWRGPFKKFKTHRDNCRIKTIECEACGGLVVKDKEADHEILECPKRKVPCPQCKQPITVEDVENHCDECPKRNGSRSNITIDASLGAFCPFECQTIVKSIEEYKRHCNEFMERHIALLRRLIISLKAGLVDPRPDNAGGSNQDNSSTTQATPSAEPHMAEALESLDVRTKTLEEKMKQYENLNSVLVREIEKETTKNDMLERSRKLDRDLLDNVEKKLKSLERTIALKDITITEMDLRIQVLEQTSYDGCITWRITNVSRKRQEAVSGRTTSIYSPVFFTGKKGYKICGRIYLNGDGMGKGTHISLYIVLMRGHYDALLSWPFKQKVIFKMVDQNKKEDIVDSFRPDPTSSSFRRPTSEMNVASGCPMFMKTALLDNSQYGYVKDDVAFVEISVEMP